jgi:hypothetical protein
MFDVVLEVGRVDGQDNQRRLTCIRRGEPAPPLTYIMDDEERLTAIADARSRSRVDAESDILAVVNASTEPLTSIEVRRRTPGLSRDAVRRVLTAHAVAGLILRDPPIGETAARRTVRWLAVPLAQSNLAQNSLSLSGEFGAPDGAAPDSAKTTAVTEPNGPCPSCGQPGWHPPCRPAPPRWSAS